MRGIWEGEGGLEVERERAGGKEGGRRGNGGREEEEGIRESEQREEGAEFELFGCLLFIGVFFTHTHTHSVRCELTILSFSIVWWAPPLTQNTSIVSPPSLPASTE